ncbi:hypothetical protein [Aureivirga sp. CE67]|uniref:hypothetical protein n=1 Tax=Aureivirga sp. CE67 TaxID=1788983 RepID=UPI0018C9439C|nr:hypothetical protein [Aureivirga sp. CE67]
MKLKIAFLLFYCSLGLFAQSVDEYVNNYYKETNKIITESVSTYKSCYPEIEEKIKNSERDTIGWYLIEEGIHLSEKAFHNLTPKEHFVYALFIPESFNQSCYISFYPENRFQKIVPFLKSINFSFVTSTRQLEKLKKHKEISIELI